MKPNFNIVLIEPEIPNNTGSIGRTCVGTGSKLHLVGKLGFDISDKAVKRAGLDYWKDLDLTHHQSFEDLLKIVPDPTRMFFMSKKATQNFFTKEFKLGDWLVFGKETKGLSSTLLNGVNPHNILRIPQWGPIRSLNLSNAVSIVLFEAARQTLVASGIPEDFSAERI